MGYIGTDVHFSSRGGTQAGQFSSIDTLAVNSSGNGSGVNSGDFYAGDVASAFSNGPSIGRIQQFDQSGNFIRQWGWDVVRTGPGDTGGNEQQTITVPSGVNGGTYTLKVIFATTNGTCGNCYDVGSNILNQLNVFNGAFQVGDKIQASSSAAIPAGTTITAWDPEANILEISNPISGNPSGGLTAFEVSEPIDWDAPATGAGSVQEALENLPGIGAGNVSVSSATDASGTTYTVNLDGGNLASDDVAPMTADSSFLSGGVVGIATLANGGGFEVCDQPTDPYENCKFAVHAEPPGTSEGPAGEMGRTVDLEVEPTTGNVFVSESRGQGNRRYDIYSSEGEFQGAFGWDVAANGDPGDTGTGLEFCTIACQVGADNDPEGGRAGGAIAFDPSTGNLYAAANSRINEFSLTHNGAGEVTGATFLLAFGLDVVASGPDDTGTGFEVCNKAANPTDVCKGGGGGSTTGGMGGLGEIAVDSAGVIYTTQDQNFGGGVDRVQAFTPSPAAPPYTSYAPALFASADLAPLETPQDVAIASGDRVFVVVDALAGTTTCPDGSASYDESIILEFDSSGTRLDTHLTCRNVDGFPMKLDADLGSDNLYFAAGQNLDPTSPFGQDTRRGVFFVADSDPPIVSIDDLTPNAAGAAVSGTFNPNGPAPGFPNSSTASYQLQYKKTVDTAWTNFGLPANGGFGFADQAVTLNLGGLESNTSYDVRIVGLKTGVANGYSTPETFTTLPTPPSIQGFSASSVTATSADLNANIHPHGSDTSYYFEYGPTPSYGSATPVVAIGDALSSTAVQSHIEGLDPLVYHFRVVATNDHGTVRSKDQTFNFFPPPCPNEAVRQQNGSAYLPDCRSYELVSPSNAGNVVLVNNVGLAPPYATSPARMTFGGKWGAITGTDAVNSSIDTYLATRTASGWKTNYPGVKGDQSPFVIWGGGDLGLDELMYLSLPNNEFGLGVHQPDDNLPYFFRASGEALGQWPDTNIPDSNTTLGMFQPAPDFSNIPFSSNNVDFAAGGGLTTAPGSAYDYVPATKSTTVISKTASGTDIPQEPGNTISTDEFIKFPANPLAGIEGLPVWINPSVSTDGSHILMSTDSSPASGAPVRLYMRVDGTVTYDVAGSHYVKYVGMTTDGSKVFFTSKEDLTSDGSDNDTSTDLYMWSEADDSITRVSAGAGGTGNTDECTAGWTDDCGIGTLQGSGGGLTDYPIATGTGDVYFYSPELLDGPANGVDGSQNLYVYRDGGVQFVASLRADGAEPASRIQVSADGRHAAFITASRLTTYDNVGIDEMYAYDAVRDELTCVSCIPSGDPPASNVEGSAAGIFMTDDGRTFFTTADALVQPDTNDGVDVYEFVDGRPQLITPGTGATEIGDSSNLQPTRLAGVSADGVNVYFSTFETLVEADHNGDFLKFYVARTGGGFPVSAQRQPCTAADECHGEGSSRPDPPPIASGAELGSDGNAAFNRCGPLARRAKQNSMRAKRLRRVSVRMRRATRKRRAVLFQRKARRFSRQAVRQSRGAKRCRRSARRAVK